MHCFKHLRCVSTTSAQQREVREKKNTPTNALAIKAQQINKKGAIPLFI